VILSLILGGVAVYEDELELLLELELLELLTLELLLFVVFDEEEDVTLAAVDELEELDQLELDEDESSCPGFIWKRLCFPFSVNWTISA
jgi:hypothetical protein